MIPPTADPLTSKEHGSLHSWDPLNELPDQHMADHPSSLLFWQFGSPQHHHRSSRAEAIYRGQRELMEMVKNMPESCYELSLKDLVEQPSPRVVVLESNEERLIKHKDQEISNQNKKTGKMSRSGSMHNRGLFLKMVFPVHDLGSNKKKKSANNLSNTFAKASPTRQEGSEKSTGKDLSKKISQGSRDSDSSYTSSNISGSSYTVTHRVRGFLRSFWSSINFKKPKSAK